MIIKLNSSHSLHFGAFRRNRMKAIILLLICLAVVTITQAGHHSQNRRENTSRDERKEKNAPDRSQDNRQDSREINRQDTRQDNRRDNRDYRRDDSKENNGRDRHDSRENNKQDKRQDNRREGSNDERQNNRHGNRQDRRQDNRVKNEDERRQDSRDNNEQEKRQHSWQENQQPWRDIVIENHGKIVNNGGQRDGQQRYTQKQKLLNQLGYIQTINRTKTTGIETLQKQKFLLTILLKVSDAQTEVELEELGQNLLLDEQNYTESFDDDMRHLVQLSMDGKMLQKTQTFNGFDPAHLRQLQGLYKLLVRARDWDMFQRNACFARLHLNRELFVNALLLAVKEHRETQQLIMPAMNEILPELFYDKQLLEISRTFDVDDLVIVKPTTEKPEFMDVMKSGWRRPGAGGNTNPDQQRWGRMQPKKTWQEWRQEKLDRQAGREPTQTIRNVQHTLVLATETVDNTRSVDLNKRISYLTQDVGLSNFWYSLNTDCLRQMMLPTTERKEMVRGKSLISDNQQNIKEATIDDLNNRRLLYINRRRWKQKQDLAINKLGHMRLDGLDRQQMNGEVNQIIASRQDSDNKDKSPLKSVNQIRLIVDKLQTFLSAERQRLGRAKAASKNLGIQEDLSKTNNLNTDSREDIREKDDRDSNEQLRQDRDEKIHIDGNLLLKANREASQEDRDQSSMKEDNLKTTQRLRELEDSSEVHHQDSEEDRRQDTDEPRRQDSVERKTLDSNENIDKQEGNSVQRKGTGRQLTEEELEVQRELMLQNFLRVLRRRKTFRAMQHNKGTVKKKWNLDDSIEERSQDSEEHRRQDSDEHKTLDSNQNIGKQKRNSVDEKRLLKVNRRRLNTRNMFGEDMDNLQINKSLQKLQDSSEERQQNSDEHSSRQGLDEQSRQISDQQRRQDLDEELGIDGERMLHINRRRWLNRRNMLRTTRDNQSTVQKMGKLENSSEERRQDTDEFRAQDSKEKMNTLNRNFSNDERILRINRRRLNKSIWPQQNLANTQIDQSRENRQDSDEIMRQDSAENIKMMKNSEERRRVAQDSSSQEDSNEHLNSNIRQQSAAETSEESREERNRATTNARLLAIGRRRLPRSVSNQLGDKLDLTELRTGEMKLINMQQMLARLRMERLSHQLEQVLSNKQQLSDSDQQKNLDIRQAEHIIETRDNRELLMQIQNVKHLLQTIIDEELQLLKTKNEINLKQSNMLELIGRILIKGVNNSDLDIFQVWSHLMQVSTDDSNSLMSNMAQQLREPASSFLMETILNTVNIYSDKLPSYDSQLLRMDDVQLTDIKVDKLQTYFDTSDADIINALDQNALRQQNIELKNIRNVPVMRQQRLNHKSFSIKLDIASKRANSVVIRIFLGPKLDSNGHELALNENRRNFMLLDAFRADILPGQNSIKRKSSDISWTSRDSTPLSQIYREVMQAVDGSNELQLDRLTGNNQRFPHRLLLPRGLPQGLPMQLFIIVTPQSELDALLQEQLHIKTAILGMGTAAIGLDTLPLGFPLDRRIENEQNMLVPNAMLRDIAIYHDGEINI